MSKGTTYTNSPSLFKNWRFGTDDQFSWYCGSAVCKIAVEVVVNEMVVAKNY